MEWRRIYEEWDRVRREDRAEIERLFWRLRDLGRLEEFFKLEPWAERVYREKILRELSLEQKRALEEKFIAELRKHDISVDKYRKRFEETLEAVKMLPYDMAFKEVMSLIDSIVAEEKLKKVPAAPPAPVRPPRPLEVEYPGAVMRQPIKCPTPGCPGAARFVTMTEWDPGMGLFMIRGRYVCAKCGWASGWETVGYVY